MSDETFLTTIEKIREHCEISNQRRVAITFHGGEPTLIRVDRFDKWCRIIKERLDDIAELELVIQTNGTLLDESWARAFRVHDVKVGISVDGPKSVHDANRVDHAGRGSYDKLARGVAVLKDAEVAFGILCVVPLGIDDPVGVHRQLLEMQPLQVGYLFPDETHETIHSIRARYGATPVADFLIPVFDDWWFNGTVDRRVMPFWHMARAIMGGSADSDALQNSPFRYLVVETDGEIEGLDVLRICGEGLADTGLNVKEASFGDVAAANSFHARALLGGMPLASPCSKCVERETCGGGYLPHRYSRANEFDNPSAWCADLMRLFAHIRMRMDVSFAQTEARRRELKNLHSVRELQRNIAE